MKPEKTLHFCEWCDKAIEDVWARGMIFMPPDAHISNPGKVSFALHGYYHEVACLVAKLNQIAKEMDGGS
jgi:hypothetical protein